MCYGPLGSFARGFLLYVICHYLSITVTSVYTTSLNSSEEIKNIFSTAEDIKNESDSKGRISNRNKSFAEGGIIDVNVLSTNDDFIKKLEENRHHNKNESVLERQNTTLQRNVTKSKSHSFLESPSYKTLQDKNLTEPGSDLFLGVPEVVHINGASSIKPRKGVDNENKDNFSLTNYSCFWLSKNECYSEEEAQDLKCTCCNVSNALGEIFKRQTSISCDKCKPMLLPEKGLLCKGICCRQISHDIDSISSTQDDFVKLENNSKPKPTITKVPHDVEAVTEILSKSKQKVFLPVVVSLLLLPVIGILIFFIWKKSKEYWDKRFYKRMDFLIDGMYND